MKTERDKKRAGKRSRIEVPPNMARPIPIEVVQEISRLLGEAEQYRGFHPQRLHILGEIFEVVAAHSELIENTRFREMITRKIPEFLNDLERERGSPIYTEVEWLVLHLITQIRIVQNMVAEQHMADMRVEMEDVGLVG